MTQDVPTYKELWDSWAAIVRPLLPLTFRTMDGEFQIVWDNNFGFVIDKRDSDGGWEFHSHTTDLDLATWAALLRAPKKRRSFWGRQ